MDTSEPVTEWLLQPRASDPSIRWQVMRDLLDVDEAEWALERARVSSEGWGARLLEVEDEDGQWDGGAYFPGDYDWDNPEAGQPWTATAHVLDQLRELGLPPDGEQIGRGIALIGANARWDYEDLPYWGGEVEPCINGRTVANGTDFGLDMSPLVERLVDETLHDGGWNCETERGSTRSSFDTTINVLEGLLEYERMTGGTSASIAARESGEEYLLKRSLFKRLSTGKAADPKYLHFLHPSRWHYDLLRGLDYFRASALQTGTSADSRLADAIDHVRSKRQEDGRWLLDWNPEGRTWFEVDEGSGAPSRWITLRAMRVLKWWEG